MDRDDRITEGKLPELLAPAGGKDALRAAVENGADAVYLGGKRFNARQNADNFDGDTLRWALDYAHERGVSIYVTQNTVLLDEELDEALDQAEEVYRAGADALIVQDLGLAALVRHHFPDFPLHFSTQGTVYDLAGVEAAAALGARRVVLARELSYAEIRSIAERTSVELEVFVHGALCQCYSGQCHLSSAIGGRSGNRGTCAQPCRLPYTLLRRDKTGTGAADAAAQSVAGGYLLSPKDLNLLSQADQLVESGVASLKIEGRMKTPEYVALVTAAYRKYLDAYAVDGRSRPVDPSDQRELAQIFNRGGFTTGYFLGDPGPELITRERPKHAGTYLGAVVGGDPGKRRVRIRLEAPLALGDGIEIDCEGLPGNVVTLLERTGKKADSGQPGEVLDVGDIRGTIPPGSRVYKVTDKALMQKARESYSGLTASRVPVTGRFTATAGEPLELRLWDRECREAVATAGPPEAARTRELTSEAVREQAGKTGGTPYILEELEIRLDPGLSVPLSELNRMRREALNELSRLRQRRYPERSQAAGASSGSRATALLRAAKEPSNDSRAKETPRRIALYPHQWEADRGRYLAMKAGDGFSGFPARPDRIYLPLSAFRSGIGPEDTALFQEKGIEVFAAFPAVTKGWSADAMRELAQRAVSAGAAGFLAGNLGQIRTLLSFGLPVLGDVSLNVYNSQSVAEAARLGLAGVALSHELDLSGIRGIRQRGIELEVVVGGRIPVMVTEHCVVGSETAATADCRACGRCAEGYYTLRDRKGAEFPLVSDPDSGRCVILDRQVRDDSSRIPELSAAGITTFRYYF